MAWTSLSTRRRATMEGASQSRYTSVLAPIRDARNTLNARKRGQGDKRAEATHGYHPCRGGPYDSAED
jgi:hypothetical protein